MTIPESPSNNQNEELPSQHMNEDRYWRWHNRLGRLMERLDVRVEGRERFESLATEDSRQGVIVAPTHTSWLDISALAPAHEVRQMRFMVKGELWRIPFLAGLLDDGGAYPVDRSDEVSRKASFDRTVQLLESGEWVVLYPEGTRNSSKDRYSLGRARTGVARAALQASGMTPIVPVGIGYREGLLRRKASPFHVGVVVGEPLFVEHRDASNDEVRSLTADVGSKLYELKPVTVDLAES